MGWRTRCNSAQRGNSLFLWFLHKEAGLLEVGIGFAYPACQYEHIDDAALP
jgi:hypothetical protein